MPDRIPRLSWGVVLEGLWLPLLFWTVAVLVVTASGRHEIARWTPAAWLLAIPVGLRIGARSPNAGTQLARNEAFVAGVLLGLWLSLLAFLIDGSDWLYQTAVGLVGILVCAGLSFLAARRTGPH